MSTDAEGLVRMLENTVEELQRRVEALERDAARRKGFCRCERERNDRTVEFIRAHTSRTTTPR